MRIRLGGGSRRTGMPAVLLTVAGSMALAGSGPGVASGQPDAGGAAQPLCSQVAVQAALDHGGDYQLCDEVQLASQLTLTHGDVTLSGGQLRGAYSTGASTSGSRVIAVHGGTLTLVNVTLAAHLEPAPSQAQPGATGSDGASGADGTSGVGAGQNGTSGTSASSTGANGHSGVALTAPDPEDAGRNVLRGGCMFVAAGAKVYLDGGTLSCEAGGIQGATGGSGGRGGNGGNAGQGGTGQENSTTGAGGNGGKGGNATDGGDGADGRNGMSAQGGGVYNAGSLYVIDTTFSSSAVGTDGGNGGNGGAGGNAGNGGDGGPGYPTDQYAGGNGGNAGNAGSGGKGGNGGNAGSGEGGGIYNTGHLVLAGATFNRNAAYGGVGGNTENAAYQSAGWCGSAAAGCGEPAGYPGRPGVGGTGTPAGASGANGGLGTDGAGGNGGNSGSAYGGAVYSTDPFLDSGVTYSSNTVSCGSCNWTESQAFPSGTLQNGTPAGQPGTLGKAADPDVHGSPYCPAGGSAAAAVAVAGGTQANLSSNASLGARANSATTTPSCPLLRVHAYKAPFWYRFANLRNAHGFPIIITWQARKGLRVPKFTLSFQYDELRDIIFQHNEPPMIYGCDITSGSLQCSDEFGGGSKGFVVVTATGGAASHDTAIFSAVGQTVHAPVGPVPSDRELAKTVAANKAADAYADAIEAFDPTAQLEGISDVLRAMFGSPSTFETRAFDAARGYLVQADPPDSAVSSIALPAPPKLPAVKSPCSHVKPKRRASCGQFRAALQRDNEAVASDGAIQAAVLTAMDRGHTATNRHDMIDASVQDAAIGVLIDEDRAVVASENAAAVKLARIVRQTGDGKVKASALRRASKKLARGDLPKRVLTTLAKWGLTKQQVDDAMRHMAAGYHPRTIDAAKAIGTQMPVPAAAVTDLGGLTALAAGLRNARQITSGELTAIDNAAQTFASSGSAAKLRSAIDKVHDKAARTFLLTAAAYLGSP